MMSRAKRMGLVPGVVAGLLLVEAAVLAVAALGRSRAEAELRRSAERLARLHDRDPFPSAENLEVERGSLDRFEYGYGEFFAELAADPFPADDVEAADFSARAQGVVERLRKRAGGAGVKLPKSLEAGFAQYASGGAVPDPQHVPRLVRQLYSVERVADVLVGGGVDSIDRLSRDEFEVQGEEAEAPSRGRRHLRRPTPTEGGGDRAAQAASFVHPQGGYMVERIEASFTAREDALWRVLELFATAPHFMVVREFAHRTDTRIPTYDPEAVKRGEGPDEEMARYLAEGILTGKEALPRTERIIAGQEAVSVDLVVEVYNFEMDAPSNGEAR